MNNKTNMKKILGLNDLEKIVNIFECCMNVGGNNHFCIIIFIFIYKYMKWFQCDFLWGSVANKDFFLKSVEHDL